MAVSDLPPPVYSGLDKTVEYIVESTAAETALVNVRWPISDNDLVSAFEAKIESINANEGRRVRLALFDTVASMPGVNMPYERLSQSCKKHQVLSLVDGAHGIGHIPLDLRKLDADFFLSNIHKLVA